MGPKIFTVREANELLPHVEGVFRELDSIRDRLRRIKSKIDVLEMIWGEEIEAETNPDRREYSHYLDEVEKLKREFDGASKRFAEMEVYVKSMDTGLVDFYGVIDGRLVFLCWKRGEKGVEWFHHVDEGFAGRRQIPSQELAR